MFKALVGMAALVVIAAGGYFFVNEWQASKRTAEASEFNALRTKCLAALDRLATDEDVTFASNCYVFKGAITKQEYESRVARQD